MVHDLDVKVLMFSHYGKNVPKQHELSPDGFVQSALQLAYYRCEITFPLHAIPYKSLQHSPRGLFLNSRMYDACCSTIETASLRMFKYGRTDAIRVTSVDSLKFVQAMQDPSKQVLFCTNAHFLGAFQPRLKVHYCPLLKNPVYLLWIYCGGHKIAETFYLHLPRTR